MNSRKIAWITGAGKGIGRGVAKKLAEEGWIVAVSARTKEDLESLASECGPNRIHSFPLDVTDAEATKTIIDAVEKQLGQLDLVILNAGTHAPMSADDFSIHTVRKLMEINLMGTANGLEPILSRFIERRSGHVAVVASIAGYRGLPTSSAYGATKAGLINMCEALKPELERHNVRLQLINPGFVETPLTDRNDFPMPLLITVDEAASRIVNGLKSNAFEISFPTRFALLMKFLRILPNWLFFMATRKLVR